MPDLTLDTLNVGEVAVVAGLSSEGAERRRMVDLGILPGTRIEVLMRSPLGDPIAYRVRGATVALRREQAARIAISRDLEGVR
jgi:ferrous iron transport protein A